MSKRNTQEAKREARERLRVEREKQAKKDKMRRQLGVAGAVVVVLAVAGGIGIAVTNMSTGGGEGDNSDWSAASQVAEKDEAAGDYAKYTAPANTEGEDGTDVVIGDQDAADTVTVYEDMRCPVCASFEQGVGETLIKDIEDGKYKAEFVFGTFLDGDNAEGVGSNGSGSKNALSALGAALDVSPEAFLEYKKLLYSPDNHPDERIDEFADDQKLIDMAQDVEELKGNDAFEKAVNEGTFDPWALKMSDKFRAAPDVTGTPTVKVNGQKMGGEQGSVPHNPEQYNQMVDALLAK
ncbi:thioredoxin domain-containing protein [Streptomyces sp. TRM 70351]|uniref:thioredoxin domain-containing protein n=1 Tax=Streptomyces sp. TRM 70351 TaxID=3116552 RepID=UPI002E7BE390|nr:thioredoxin domain-containing protein [Streptomyces sp. TRM 70351]MEE1930451.1 thioredoxin domain-containing protein [Streptomyces sp. TRM 70351]